MKICLNSVLRAVWGTAGIFSHLLYLASFYLMPEPSWQFGIFSLSCGIGYLIAGERP